MSLISAWMSLAVSTSFICVWRIWQVVKTCPNTSEWALTCLKGSRMGLISIWNKLRKNFRKVWMNFNVSQVEPNEPYQCLNKSYSSTNFISVWMSVRRIWRAATSLKRSRRSLISVWNELGKHFRRIWMSLNESDGEPNESYQCLNESYSLNVFY